MQRKSQTSDKQEWYTLYLFHIIIGILDIFEDNTLFIIPFLMNKHDHPQMLEDLSISNCSINVNINTFVRKL